MTVPDAPAEPTTEPSPEFTADDTTEPVTRLVTGLGTELDGLLREADAALARDFPGPRAGRQPVHTVYVPAHRLEPGLTSSWGELALAAVDAHPEVFDATVGDADVVAAVRRKLATEPVEDLRIDFEDGFGPRPDTEEDGAVDRAADLLRESLAAGSAPPFTGIRFKSFEAPTRRRGLRTLARFLHRLTDGGRLPDGFVVTLPKVTSVAQVEAMVVACRRIEASLGLDRPIGFEIQVETPQAVLGPDGTPLVAGARACTTAPTTTPPRSASPPSTRPWTTPPPTTPRP